MKALYFLILSQLAACSTGCASTYLNAKELEDLKMGPKACEDSCRQIGMEMGALALIDTSHTGCVCVPAAAEAQAAAPVSAPPAPIQPGAPVESAPAPPPAPPGPDASGQTPQARASENHAAVVAGAAAILADEQQQQQQQAQANAQRVQTRR